jgi:hypothetical protein
MKRLYFTLITMSLLVACTSGLENPITSKTPQSADPDAPVSSDNPQPSDSSEPSGTDLPQLPGPGGIITNDDPLDLKFENTIPREGDNSLLRGAVYLDSIDLLTMESYPLQFSLALTGNLPTPCNELRVSIAPPDEENKILVDVYSLSTPDKFCSEVLQPFTQTTPLGSFPAGHYTLWVNGEQVAEFDA